MVATSVSVSDSRCLQRRRSRAAALRGLIGYRSLVKAGNGKRLGIYGFGAARISSPRCKYQQAEIYAFTAQAMRTPNGSLEVSAPHGPAFQ